MTAVVYPLSDGYHVGLYVGGSVDPDDAGPFDDLTDALGMAKRWTSDVVMSDSLWFPPVRADGVVPLLNRAGTR